jgi:uncharacterized protein (TIGR03435 family)
MTRSALILASVCGAAVLSAQAPAQQSDGARFEVVSVRPLPATTGPGGRFRPDPTRFSGDFTVVNAVAFAYRIEPNRVVGAPQWATDQRYQINATTPPRKPGDIQQMMRHLLEERFALKAHRESRPIAVYALLMARADGSLGPGLQRVERDCTKPASNLSGCSVSSGVGRFRANGQPWGTVVGLLDGGVVTGRPLVDKTGLSGQFDITIEWNPEITRVPEGVSNPPTLAELEARPALFTAVREQLGLRLEPDTAAIDVVVIDSVERPTPD